MVSEIADRSAKVGVLGLGYVGLPLAEVAHRAGFEVIGYDTDPTRVAQLERGESPFRHLAKRLAPLLADRKRFRATGDLELLATCSILLVAVPTPLGPHREPDLECVERAGKAIASILRPGSLVVLESTTYPGTTREVLGPILERRGLVRGSEYFLAYSPEREDPGRDTEVQSIPKVLGAVDEASHRIAAEFYGACFSQVVPVSSAEVAEACKLVENIYRSVNIALVNELKVVFAALGLDIWEVMAAASTKPYGFHAFEPGPGLGGHCIPVDPFYLSWRAKEVGRATRFIELAGEINAGMPRYVVERVVDALNERERAANGSRVLVVGIAYKRNIDDVRESPALELLAQLRLRGAIVSYHDPHVPEFPDWLPWGAGLRSEPLDPEFVARQDAVVVVTDHAAIDWEVVARAAPLIVDTRHVYSDGEVSGELWRA